MKHEIIPTADGSKTLFLPEMQEQYHSVNGAMTESTYVFIEKGFHFQQKETPTIFEIGFGTGLNALLTALEAQKQQRKTTYISIEKYPLEEELLLQLNYGELISADAQHLYKKIHQCTWNKATEITSYFSLFKLQADILTVPLTEFGSFDIIYFDAFGPDKQPEMWTPNVFNKIFALCSNDAVLVTYSAKGEVRRQLSAAGFQMERLPGPPGKKQMLRGIKKISIL